MSIYLRLFRKKGKEIDTLYLYNSGPSLINCNFVKLRSRSRSGEGQVRVRKVKETKDLDLSYTIFLVFTTTTTLHHK